ncbi:hypothetical protein [Pseudobacteriovorax antillogorgiicola]|uniref:Uncharacterized protein n=1 Tax=Pseudobacteriovorax antillogorgiicola TaxID=1513793 RepID=A0A1Y6C5G2_9BACT|nr:hypothetical protein [Pseudobacteriovorax antillogorgiicola]TCS49428.1 hypothetical protein EDD56_115109 [Pseudobacteriovorax antillogorgiicola]SMF46717.1 hypothetical protein SAMN06296036_11475 [Pseudobacteriovorax antillogorgiicola]
MKVIQDCKCCGEKTRVRHRDFSPHAWAVLMHWEEIDASAVGQPICDSCYDDLRELLIERSREVDAAMAHGQIQQLQFVVDQTLSKVRDTPIAS